MNKNELRIKYKEIRKNILDKEVKSKIIIDKILKLDEYKKAKVVGLYKSLKDEVNVENLINISLDLGKTVAVPKVQEDKMIFVKIDKDTKFINGKYNILEPKEEIIIDNLDLVIMPGICFDKENNRIGFGKGYYDKYLSNKKIKKAGICFKKQVVKKINVDINDIKVDLVITD